MEYEHLFSMFSEKQKQDNCSHQTLPPVLRFSESLCSRRYRIRAASGESY